jgi:septum formation protein
MKIILASQSKSRRKALNILGLKYEVIPSNFDEKSLRHENPQELAKRLAEAKARAVGQKENDALIIASDLFVVFQGNIYEKPKDLGEAESMLRSYSGNKLDIVAGLAVYDSKKKKMISKSEKHTVKFRKLTDYEIKDYMSRYPVLNFSGAFEEEGSIRFCKEGKYPFFYGIPMESLIKLLRKSGVEV